MTQQEIDEILGNHKKKLEAKLFLGPPDIEEKIEKINELYDVFKEERDVKSQRIVEIGNKYKTKTHKNGAITVLQPVTLEEMEEIYYITKEMKELTGEFLKEIDKDFMEVYDVMVKQRDNKINAKDDRMSKFFSKIIWAIYDLELYVCELALQGIQIELLSQGTLNMKFVKKVMNDVKVHKKITKANKKRLLECFNGTIKLYKKIRESK